MSQAWRQSRLDLVEQSLQTILSRRPLPSGSEGRLSADLVATLHEIGRDALERGDVDVAIRWLSITATTLSEFDLGDCSEESKELMLGTYQLLSTSINDWVNSMVAETHHSSDPSIPRD